MTARRAGFARVGATLCVFAGLLLGFIAGALWRSESQVVGDPPAEVWVRAGESEGAPWVDVPVRAFIDREPLERVRCRPSPESSAAMPLLDVFQPGGAGMPEGVRIGVYVSTGRYIGVGTVHWRQMRFVSMR